MYRIHTHEPAREAIAALSNDAARSYAEALGLIKLLPWNGALFRAGNPDGNIRTLPFGPGGLVVYLILERDQEVHILEVQWAG